MDEDIKEFFKILVLIFVTVLILLFGIVLIFFPFGYYSSCKQAEIFNEKHGANYTGWDFFWAKSQINQQVQTIKLEK